MSVTTSNQTIKNEKRTIIINKMFVGRYLDYGENIGHEAINLRQSKNGKYYIFLCSKGFIEGKHVKGAKIVNIDGVDSGTETEIDRDIDVLLVYPIPSISSRVYQVLALAKNVSVLDSAIINNNEDKNIDNLRKKQETIEYEGVRISDILRFNYNSELNNSGIFATFIADNLFVPKEPLFLLGKTTKDKDKDIEKYKFFSGNYKTITTKSGFGNSSMRLFYPSDDKDKEDSYNDLKRVIDKDEYWKEASTDEKHESSYHEYFLSVIKEENRELTFSNLLQYVLSDGKRLKLFYKEILKLETSAIKGNNFELSVNREERNVDLIIRDSKNIILIENKIHSGINGVADENGEGVERLVEKQIESALGIRKSKEKEEHKNNKRKEASEERKEKETFCEDLLNKFRNNDSIQNLTVSQLSKYYFYSQWIASKERKQAKLFILCPEYQKPYFEQEKNKYLYGDKYIVISYLDIYNHFSKYKWDDVYVEEFIKAIYKHTKEQDNSKKDEVLSRFQKAIEREKGQQQ